MAADDDNGPARNGILLRPETDASDGNLTCRFVPRRIALCPTTLEAREPFLFSKNIHTNRDNHGIYAPVHIEHQIG